MQHFVQNEFFFTQVETKRIDMRHKSSTRQNRFQYVKISMDDGKMYTGEVYVSYK